MTTPEERARSWLATGVDDLTQTVDELLQALSASQEQVRELDDMVQRAAKLVYDMLNHDDMRANDGYDSMAQHNAVVERLRAEQLVVCNWWLKRQTFHMEQLDDDGDGTMSSHDWPKD